MPSDNIPAGPWAQPVPFVGGSGGSNWDSGACGWVEGVRGLLVKKLDMWWDDERVRGLRITFSDDSASPIYGFSDKNHAFILFNLSPTATDPGPERVTTMWMAKNGDGGRLGKIHIETSRGQNWEKGVSKTRDQVELNVGTGVFVGMAGRFGWDVDAAAALFLRSPVVKLAIKNVKYTPDPRGTDKNLSPVAINEGHCSNPADAHDHITWEFGGDVSREVTMSHDMTSTNTFGGSVSVEVSGEVFGIGAKGETGFEWQSKQSQTTSTSTTESVTFSWSISGDLEPGKAITCKAIVQRGTLDLNYTATVTATLKDGFVITYPESGFSKAVSYSGLRTKVEPAPLPK